ncbi:MAG TPA: hypothetical protein VM681_08105 [Candidatus Thermoplasmatota archaeon]|nr:hypothetical protein [Candidatus Thermoplasmatota archaeon]
MHVSLRDLSFSLCAVSAIVVGGWFGGFTVGAGLAAVLAIGALAAVLLRPARNTPRREALRAVATGAPAARPRVAVAGRPLRMEQLPLAGPILRSLDAGKRTLGKCGKCGTSLTLSARRPVKARCPVCGHAKVLV